MNSNWSYSPETPNLGQIGRFLEPCDLEIWRMTLKNNRPPLLCYFKPYASFRSRRWIQDGVTVRKRPIWVKIDDFFEPCDFAIWRMTLNKANLRDLIAATCLVFSNWIQIINFSAPVTVKFDGWPQKTIGHFFYTTSSFVHHFKSIGEFKLDLESRNTQFGSKWWYVIPCDLEIWWMTLENIRTPLLCYFMLCAAFRTRWWIQT